MSTVRHVVLRWYRDHARDLPWRRTVDPYKILVSEVMLQQTQVDRVVPRYRAFLKRFPTLRALSNARLADVLRAWSGLGYNRRARYLWEGAREAVRRCGRLPREDAGLRALPGVGPYTAAAVRSFAYHARSPVVDTNIRRVLARLFKGRDSISDVHAWSLAAEVLPPRGAARWSQALMDIGALFCRARPDCDRCPLRGYCRWADGRSKDRTNGRSKARPLHRSGQARPLHFKGERFEGSRRYYRGRIVRVLTQAQTLTWAQLGRQVRNGFDQTDLPWLEDLLCGLERDGLVALDRRRRQARLH